MHKIIIGILLALAFFFSWQLPNSNTLTISEIQSQSSALLIPLDSRPVCTKLPQKLAKLAGYNLILPPKEYLDNYRTPANTEKMRFWLKNNINGINSIFISTDMLLNGGLLHARKNTSTAIQQDLLIKELKELSEQNKAASLFQVIPRLLVSDELIPDRWYKYRLLKYSELYDVAQTLGDLSAAYELQSTEKSIPPDILAKYKQLYKMQDRLNVKLLSQATPELQVIIGQDDGSPLGLHQLSARLVDFKLAKNSNASARLTYGADEIASVLIAKAYLKQAKAHPSIYIYYADASAPNLIMPYLPCSVEGVLQEKIALLGATRANTPDKADIILYVSCGNDNYRPSVKQARELAKLLCLYPQVALLDLSANFEEYELLMPQLLSNKVPINQLCAYAGWNTFSNSAGTVLAQACIYTTRRQELQKPQDRLQLATENYKLILERLFDDYCYQKKLHAKLKKELLTRGLEPTELSSSEKAYAQAFTQIYLQNEALLLLYTNLGTTPYYEDAKGSYYLKKLKLQATYPWNRIFEIDLKLQPTFGIVTKRQHKK